MSTCCRCHDEVAVWPANCSEKPERMRGLPLGMYHCPDCGAMVLAGVPHPMMCAQCLKGTHPRIDGVPRVEP